MDQFQVQPQSKHSQYQPYPWIFWIRMAQLGLAVLTIVLCIYASTQSIVTGGVFFSFWSVAYSLVWVPIATWFLPRLPGRYRPNLIFLVLECLCCFWWFIGFILIATYVSNISRIWYSAYYDEYCNVRDRNDVCDTYNAYIGNFDGALGAVKAAAAFAAVTWVLFIVTFVSMSLKLYKERRGQSASNQQMAEYPNGPVENNAAMAGADKQAHASAHTVQV